jgi:uncharacterized membrane-anchored protein
MTKEGLTLLNRVPHLIVLYWIIKIAATTLGETGADMFSFALDLGYLTTIVIFMLVFIFLLGIKLSVKGYHPVMYWMTFTASAIVGTAISDFLDRTLGLGYLLGSSILMVLLLITLYLWYKKEGSIAVDNIITFHAEIYYWIAFLIANTLGTALGDYIADDIGLGFLNSALLIGITLSIIALLHYYSNISKIVLFWLAFVLTRPFGASFGDLLTKPDIQGGLGLGTIGASLFFVIVLVIALHKETILERSRKKSNN